MYPVYNSTPFPCFSSEDDDDDVDSLDFRLGHLDERADDEEDDRSDWFSVVGDSEHASTARSVFLCFCPHSFGS